MVWVCLGLGADTVGGFLCALGSASIILPVGQSNVLHHVHSDLG